MFNSRADKIAKIMKMVQLVRRAHKQDSASDLESAIASLESALAGVSVEGEDGNVVQTGHEVLAAARPELSKRRANEALEEQQRLQAMVQPCVKCRGRNILVSEHTSIEIWKRNAADESRGGGGWFDCVVVVCAACGDTRFVADVTEVGSKASFKHVTLPEPAPYRG